MSQLLAFLCAGLPGLLPASGRDDRFDGSMSEETLRSDLSRFMTLMHLLTGQGDFDDNLRMMKDTGMKFAGRAIAPRWSWPGLRDRNGGTKS